MDHSPNQRARRDPQSEGAGRPGAAAPVASCVKCKTHELVTTGGGGSIRPSLRSGFNGFLRALPSDRAFLPLSPARRGTRVFANLTPASGRQDHTTSPSAASSLVRAGTAARRRRRVHRIPNPTLVTIAKRPSIGNGALPARHGL